MVLTNWFDKHTVVTASNFFGVGKENEVERWDQKKGFFVKIQHPGVVKRYNQGMGGVDKLNQLISLYRTEIRSRRITHPFDLAGVNSWLEYQRDKSLLGVSEQ